MMTKIDELIAKIKEMAERPDVVAWGNREYYVALSIIEAALAELESQRKE